VLAINADDYGYASAYDTGIVEAARAGAIDGASLMVTRRPDPAPLIETGVDIGLHLEAEPPPAEQAAAFERLVGRPPGYLDGHHHVHAQEPLAAKVAELATRLGVPVRSVDDAHRAFLRERGVATADRLVGRLDEAEPAVPEEIAAWLAGSAPGGGVTEWLVHPGHPDPSTRSGYDAGRAEDLALLLELGDRERWAARGISRCSLARALGS
jgi:chitin disaccharide deacetylase